jgi:predicted kinase
MVTGEPGSGKTSLALELSEALRVPFLSRDHVRGGLLATAGLWTNQLRDPGPREAAVEALVELVEAAARLGITAVLEFVVTAPRVEALRRIEAAGNCLVVLTVAADASARADRRDRRDPLLNRPDVLGALGHGSIDDYVRGPQRALVRAEMQSEFELPLLRVATDDGYDPSLDEIVDWIVERTRS